MSTRRKPVVKRRRNQLKSLVAQVANHLFKNRMTTLVGLGVGLPVIVEGYAQRDWHAIGKGFTELALGVSGDDRFGYKGKSSTEVTPIANGQPPFE
ncbi:hypothetical protein [Fibrella forsythiae]|uniref:Uncharacterized protein n=1 Tax=Fibrella forsythiae TaxID=2817061 RepID=A0ABS3JAJ9_9BACT|nr:hypothetical protein [Fibrella forsythiae]MBO0947004.1 hypothetical protein [Fibrella forsythiae]